MYAGVLLIFAAIGRDKIENENLDLYVDLVDVAYDFNYEMGEYDKSKLNSVWPEKFDFDKFAGGILGYFNEKYRFVAHAGNPNPKFKMSIVKFLMNPNLEHEAPEIRSEKREECAKFFAYYAPEGRKVPDWISQEFSVDHLNQSQQTLFLDYVNHYLFEHTKKLWEFKHEKSLKILHFIAEMFVKNLMDFEKFQTVFKFVVGDLKKSRNKFNIQCYEELITEEVLEKLDGHSEILMEITEINKINENFEENTSCFSCWK
jgi:hypothetical protein